MHNTKLKSCPNNAVHCSTFNIKSREPFNNNNNNDDDDDDNDIKAQGDKFVVYV